MSKIVGILNSTPDSFSDGGFFMTPETALIKAQQMIQAGASFIDIGGESTAPHNIPISFEEEFSRISVIIKTLLSSNIPCSLDSYKSKMWKYFLENGGLLLNDVSGMQKDADEKWELLRQFPKARVVIMFSCQEKILTTQTVIPAIHQFFTDILQKAKQEHIDSSRIILDTGMGGFLSPIPEVSFMVLQNLDAFLSFGSELYVGTSRKSFLREVSDPAIPANRDVASCLTSLFALQKGASFVRVHNVAMMNEMIKTDVLLNGL